MEKKGRLAKGTAYGSSSKKKVQEKASITLDLVVGNPDAKGIANSARKQIQKLSSNLLGL